MNNHQTESKNKGKNPSQLSNLMFQRDKNNIQNRNLNKNLEILRKPRSQEYLRLADILINLRQELGELEAQIEKETKRLTTLQESPKEKWWETKVPEKVPIKESQEKKIFESKGRLLQLKERHQSLLEEFKYTMEKFVQETPIPDKLLGIIYPDYNEKLLLKYGIISCPGEAFCTEEELIEIVNPDNKKIEEQWRKAFKGYCQNRENNLLLVEIYMDMVCVIFKSGETLVIE